MSQTCFLDTARAGPQEFMVFPQDLTPKCVPMVPGGRAEVCGDRISLAQPRTGALHVLTRFATRHQETRYQQPV
jgi:hypothetical protein